VGKYLKLAREAAGLKDVETHSPATQEVSNEAATKATKATKAPAPSVAARDQSDQSDKRHLVRVLTLREVLAEINSPGTGPAKNAELYRRGELSEEKAVEYVARAILHRRGSSFEGWRAQAPTVRAALTHGVGCNCEVCA
jgi:hypothetical protein